MATRIGINGFGRIGRCVVRALYERNITDLEVVADQRSHRSAHAGAPLPVRLDSSRVQGPLRVSNERVVHPHRQGQGQRPREEATRSELPWKELGVDIVLECTGLFTDKEKAELHVKAGAKKVLISAPAKNQDLTVVMGVNDSVLRSQEALHPLERLVHHELSRAGGQGPPRYLRDQGRPHDDDSFVHQRSAHPRRAAPQGRSAPRARRRREHDPLVDGRRQGARRSHPGAQGQVRRPGDPRADDGRVDRRPRLPDREGGHQGRDPRSHEGGERERAHERHPRLHGDAARLVRLHRHAGLERLRRHDDAGAGHATSPRSSLVRQRVGLLESHDRSRSCSWRRRAYEQRPSRRDPFHRGPREGE